MRNKPKKGALSASSKGPKSSLSKEKNKEKIFPGLGVSPGIIIGTAHVRESGAIDVPEYTIPLKFIGDELERFGDAVERARMQIRSLKAKVRTLPEESSEELDILLDAHLHMLVGSRLIRGVEQRISQDRLNAEAAVQEEISAIAKNFSAMEDAYLAARIEDIREVGKRLIRCLIRTPQKALATLPKGSIILAEELTPSDTALLDPKKVVGFATVLGGAESHTAIMARSLMMPAVLGIAGLVSGVHSGDTVIVDGGIGRSDEGRVIVNPSAATLEEYEQRRAAFRLQRQQLTRLKRLPARTLDGTDISLQANIELPREIKSILAAGAEGIGLLRSEFMYMNRDDLPGEEEQYAALRDLVIAMKGRPVTVRTLDVGGEKLAHSLGDHITPGPNPALGLRAIRLSLKVPEILTAQLAAILRASAHGPVRILLPMISSISEVRRVRRSLKAVAQKLEKNNVKIAEALPPLGVMIETPGAALAADSLARASDFFSIGTNDLTMYTLAIDRGDEQVAHIYNPLHPAVLRLIQFTTTAGQQAGIPVSICGEIAGHPQYTALALGLGLRELSMSAANISRVKQRIRGIDMEAAERLARTVMEQSDPGRISMLLDDFNSLA